MAAAGAAQLVAFTGDTSGGAAALPPLPTSSRCPFAVLQLARPASLAALSDAARTALLASARTAYRRLCLLLHPDKNVGEAPSETAQRQQRFLALRPALERVQRLVGRGAAGGAEEVEEEAAEEEDLSPAERREQRRAYYIFLAEREREDLARARAFEAALSAAVKRERAAREAHRLAHRSPQAEHAEALEARARALADAATATARKKQRLQANTPLKPKQQAEVLGAAHAAASRELGPPPPPLSPAAQERLLAAAAFPRQHLARCAHPLAVALLLDCPVAVHTAVAQLAEEGWRALRHRAEALLRAHLLDYPSVCAMVMRESEEVVLQALRVELGDEDFSQPLHAAAALGADGALMQLLVEGARHLPVLLLERDAGGRTPAEVAVAAGCSMGGTLQALQAALQGEPAQGQQRQRQAQQQQQGGAAEGGAAAQEGWGCTVV